MENYLLPVLRHFSTSEGALSFTGGPVTLFVSWVHFTWILTTSSQGPELQPGSHHLALPTATPESESDSAPHQIHLQGAVSLMPISIFN